jgi:hypothetical protein
MLIPRPAATVQFLASSGTPASTYTCEFVSNFFRTVEFELDCVADVEPFKSYDTSRLPAPGRARVLTTEAAYAEAGLEMIDIGDGVPVPIELAGADRIWTNAELQAAMEEHFQQWSPDAGWRVWLLAATRHEDDRLRGIMFDDERRQGCAVFHDMIGGNTDQIVRAMLRTYVHELGHCFNLYHSHQKHFMTPPQPDRLDALSWMQYPAYYKSSAGSGEGAYWRAFPFQFDDDELVHLRHGFRNTVIPGGEAFGIGAADLAADVFSEPIADESGLRLGLRAPDRFLLGTPVVVEIKLSLTDLRGRKVNRMLHPNMGYLQIGIAKPGGHTLVYRPIITHCGDPDMTTLSEQEPSIYESAYIGYGKHGHYFDSPGMYSVRALYNAPDGSVIVSNILRLRVLAPIDRDEHDLAELFLGEDQGSLLYLLGSDSDRLAGGRNSFHRVLERYPSHPMADYARLVEGINALRPFKRIEAGVSGVRVVTRTPDRPTGTRFLRTLFDATKERANAPTQATEAPASRVPQLDNISLGMAVRCLGKSLKTGGDEAGADDVLTDLLHFYASVVKVPPHVLAHIQRQVSDDPNGSGQSPVSEANQS